MTLFDRLGGEEALSAVVDKFYDMMLADSRVNVFFKNSDMQKQRLRMKQFLTMATGGPNKYEGADMKEAHKKMKIGKEPFDATW